MCLFCCKDVASLVEECENELQESKASAILGRRVDAMISKIDSTLHKLEDAAAERRDTEHKE